MENLPLMLCSHAQIYLREYIKLPGVNLLCVHIEFKS